MCGQGRRQDGCRSLSGSWQNHRDHVTRVVKPTATFPLSSLPAPTFASRPARCWLRTRGCHLHDVYCSLAVCAQCPANIQGDRVQKPPPSYTPLPLLLPPPCHPRIMAVLSEHSTIPADTPQPALTPTSDAPIAIPDVVVNGKRPIASATPLQQRPKSSSSSLNTASTDEWGSNFWVTLVDPQVSAFSGLEWGISIRSSITWLDSDPILCVSCDWPSKLGPSYWQLPVSVNGSRKLETRSQCARQSTTE